MPARRLNFNQVVRKLIRHVAATVPEFSHVRANRILVVAGEARRASRGTVKPLAFAGGARRSKAGKKPLVKVQGRRMLYCITLRPLFFRASTPKARIATLLHELFHISPKFDGTLSPSRRHAKLGAQFAKRLRPLIRQYLALCPPELWAPFAYDGTVKVRQWLERPGAVLEDGPGARRRYTEDQLFYGAVRMLTRRTKASAGPKAHIKVH